MAGDELTLSPSQVAGISAYSQPFAPWHDRYQEYYRRGLQLAGVELGARFELETGSRFPGALGRLRRFQDSGYLLKLPQGQRAAAAVEWAGRRLEGGSHVPGPVFDPGTGQYLVELQDGRVVKVCIDSMDFPELSSPELAQWSDVYFKTNWWPAVSYPANVEPLVNCDPTVLDRIAELRRARSTPKQYDLCCVVRVWGGRTGMEGIEHNIRLLEAVSSVRGNTFVLAVLIMGDRDAYAERLAAAGIRWTTKAFGADDLWRVTAASRLNVLRLGVHDCIPWRMTGSLAVGSTVALDQSPRSRWPTPLQAGEHFLDLGLETGEDALADAAAYEAVPGRIEAWLADAPLLESIAAANGDYFDEHLAPERVGRHVLARAVSATDAAS